MQRMQSVSLGAKVGRENLFVRKFMLEDFYDRLGSLSFLLSISFLFSLQSVHWLEYFEFWGAINVAPAQLAPYRHNGAMKSINS